MTMANILHQDRNGAAADEKKQELQANGVDLRAKGRHCQSRICIRQ